MPTSKRTQGLFVKPGVTTYYAIDDDRLVMRGFSMGGAACWQFLTHYPDVWAAAAPGAGFAETPEFLRVFQKEKLTPTWYERKLWHWYDCTDYALNTFNLPVVAYSGEDDSQKQAADVMAKAMKAEGIDLVHIIGPKTGHRYHPDSKKEINRLIAKAAAKGRDPVPKKVKFTTYTLRYNRCFWLSLHGLGEHWKKAVIEAEVTGPAAVTATTKNVTSLVLHFPAGQKLLAPGGKVKVTLDGQALEGPAVAKAGAAWSGTFVRSGDKWAVADAPPTGGKVPGLQGPIDDAFLSRFVMVRPTGKPLNDKVGKWAAAEMKHATVHWRRQFRGEAPVKDDKQVTEDDMKNANLILWGDPSSNSVLKKIADKLPVRWGAGGVTLPETKLKYAADHHAVVMVCPNPLNPRKYVVLNSGFTFREYDYLNNARQVAKLPDFAVIDVNSPVTSRAPGKVALADFFDEKWRLPKQPGKARE
jgi:Prolyl oligopeptidase family